MIEPSRGWGFPDLRELWDHRDLVYFLARRDIVARYRQAVVGTFWVVLQPILLAAAFAVFLGLVQKVDGPPGIPYELFAVTGLVMWLAFVDAVQSGSLSATSSETLITRIYLPRVAIPIASVIPSTVDFAMGFIVVVVAGFAYGFEPTLRLLTVPAIWGLAALTALGFSLWFAALNVRYRDIGQVVPFLTLVGLFVTPIIYPLELFNETVTPALQPLYALNPMVGVLEVFRWAVLGTEWPGLLLAIPVLTSVVLVVTGALYFQRAERGFADYI